MKQNDSPIFVFLKLPFVLAILIFLSGFSGFTETAPTRTLIPQPTPNSTFTTNCNPKFYTWNCDPEFPFNPLLGATPGIGRGIGGVTYQYWNFPASLDRMDFHITFHTKPRGPESTYIQLYETNIGGVHQYFGFQYDFRTGTPRTRFVWSRWGLQGCTPADETKARSYVQLNPQPDHMMPGAKPEISYHTNDGEPDCVPWVGIVYPYAWGKGDYLVRLSKTETIGNEDWYELRIYNTQSKIWTSIGKMSFPHATNPNIRNYGSSWSEIYNAATSSNQIGYFHYSLEVVGYQNGSESPIGPHSALIKYGRGANGKELVPNSDNTLDPNGRRFHVRFGEQTRRLTEEQLFKLDKK